MLISRQFDNEVVLANYQSGLYYSLVGTAADIWLGLSAGRSVDDIWQTYADGSAEEVQRSTLQGFIEQLLSEGIIVAMNEAVEHKQWSPMNASFDQPVLERYDDLRDLLLIDPIHDVGDAGWPLRANDAS